MEKRFKLEKSPESKQPPHAPAYRSCGVRGRNMSGRYLEVLKYQYSAKYASFTTAEKDYRNKVLNDKIEVSIVLDLKWVDTSDDF